MNNPVVVSVEGNWIKASIKNDMDTIARIESEVDDKRRSLLIDVIFWTAVGMRFSSSRDLSDISRQMLGLRQRYGGRTPPAIEMEMVVRRELGEEVPIGDLEPVAITVIKLLVLEQIVYDLGFLEYEIDELISQAESRVLAGEE